MTTIVDIRGHTFLVEPLGSRPRVLDLGANHGTFAQAMAERFAADVRMVEANPNLHQELSRSAICPIFHCAVIGDDAKSVRFNLAANDQGSSVLTLPEESLYECTLAETVEVPARSLPSILDEIGWDRVDLVKMDIEGAEVEVLDSLDADVLGRIAQIAVEFHSDSTFRFGLGTHVENCLKRLAEGGFLVIDFTFPRRFDVLLINTKLVRVSLVDRLKWWLIYTVPLFLRYAAHALLPQKMRQAMRRLGARFAGQSQTGGKS